jgi:hypothetical protein
MRLPPARTAPPQSPLPAAIRARPGIRPGIPGQGVSALRATAQGLPRGRVIPHVGGILSSSASVKGSYRPGRRAPRGPPRTPRSEPRRSSGRASAELPAETVAGRRPGEGRARACRGRLMKSRSAAAARAIGRGASRRGVRSGLTAIGTSPSLTTDADGVRRQGTGPFISVRVLSRPPAGRPMAATARNDCPRDPSPSKTARTAPRESRWTRWPRRPEAELEWRPGHAPES